MERIKIYVEDLIGYMGLEGNALTVVRLLLMVAVAVVLAWLAYAFCHRLVIPAVLSLLKKTDAKWDDVLFNRQVLTSVNTNSPISLTPSTPQCLCSISRFTNNILNNETERR